MEKDKVLTEEEVEQVGGGTSVELPFPTKPLVFCINCHSFDVIAKTFSVTENSQLCVVYHCNNCGSEWKTLPTPIKPITPLNSD